MRIGTSGQPEVSASRFIDRWGVVSSTPLQLTLNHHLSSVSIFSSGSNTLPIGQDVARTQAILSQALPNCDNQGSNMPPH